MATACSSLAFAAWARELKRGYGEILIAHCTDPQLGMGLPRGGKDGKRPTPEGYENDLRRCLSEIDVINGIGPDIVCITGDMANAAKDLTKDWPRLLKMYNPPLIVAPGNHDVGQSLTADTVARFKAVFGYDYRAVSVRGWRIIAVNSMYWRPNGAPTLRAEHDEWLSREFAEARNRGEKVLVAAHLPPFVKDPRERDSYENQPLEGRLARLDAFVDAGVKFYLAGHTHRFSQNAYRGMPILNAETTSWNFDNRPFGFRLLRIRPDLSYDYDFVSIAKSPRR